MSLVHAKRGWSLAVQRKSGAVVFVELENRADAKRLAGRLRAGRRDVDGAIVEGELPWAPAVHAIAGAMSIVVTLQGRGHGHFGGAFIMATIVALLTFIRINVTRTGSAALHVRSTPFGAHAHLHVYGKRVNLGSFEREPDAPLPTLARGEASTREWLARIDELAVPAGGAYRDSVDEPTLARSSSTKAQTSIAAWPPRAS